MLKNQPFDDGVVKIYTLGNIAKDGDMPKDGLTLKETIRYKERTVGMGRFWTAQQEHVKIDLLLRVQKLRNISSQDVAIPNDGKQYIIKQVQYIEEQPVMDLSLERLSEDYEIN